jgi:hypothetical protein
MKSKLLLTSVACAFVIQSTAFALCFKVTIGPHVEIDGCGGNCAQYSGCPTSDSCNTALLGKKTCTTAPTNVTCIYLYNGEIDPVTGCCIDGDPQDPPEPVPGESRTIQRATASGSCYTPWEPGV